MEQDSYIIETNNLTDSEFKNLYCQKLATIPNEDIDLLEEINMVTSIIQESLKDVVIHDVCIFQIDSQVIQGLPQLINSCFITLIKSAKEQKYKNVGIIFTTFCDYFDLDVSVTYSNLHEKLQLLIRATTERMIGSKEYRKIAQRVEQEKIKSQGFQQKTFLDLIKK